MNDLDILPSVEQNDVVEALQTSNVVVDSVAGSGKTTTCLKIARQFKTSKILLLTYNKRLKMETQEKVKINKLENITVTNYHSFAVQYYNKDCINDINLNESIICKKDQPTQPINFDLFIIDEAQDMNKLYFCTFLKILMDNQQQPNSFKIAVLGDEMQSIYQFLDADSRFITQADTLYRSLNPFPWVKLQLSQSFRVTQQIADFMNNCMLPSQRIISSKQGDNKPIYLICNPFTKMPKKRKYTYDPSNVIYNQILKLINDHKYSYDDIFILSPSIKNKISPVGSLANLLSYNNIPIFYPNSDNDQIDRNVIKSKIVFSSFHQVKGLERKVVIVFCFDITYFTFYNRNADANICTNELYVAVSRALEQLIVIQDIKKDPLPFLKIERISQFCEVIKNANDSNPNDTLFNNNSDLIVGVTELTRHISMNVMEQCLSFLEICDIQQKGKIIKIDGQSSQQMKAYDGQNIDINESVSEITGSAIPIYCEMRMLNKSSVLDLSIQQILIVLQIKYSIFNDPEKILQKLIEMKQKAPLLKPNEILYLANLWNSVKTKLNFKMNQIQEYQWLSEKQMQYCYNRFVEQVNLNNNFLEFEKELKIFVGIGEFKRHLVGFVDCIDHKNQTVWELKCVEKLKDEHFVQLAIYMRQFIYSKNQQLQQQIQELSYEIQKAKQLPFEEGEDLIYQKTPTSEIIVCQFFKQNEIQLQYTYQNKRYCGLTECFSSINTHNNEKKLLELEGQLDNMLKEYSFKIFNLLTNEIKEIKSSSLKLSKMLNLLINSKYGKKEKGELIQSVSQQQLKLKPIT